MSKISTRSKTFALLTAAAIALAACGGSGENSSSESTAAVRIKNGILDKTKKAIPDITPPTTTIAPTTTTTTVAPTTTVSTDTRSCAQGGTCVVGDVGPGGGKVFYVEPATYFTSVGSACGSACRYLEAARYGWSTATSPGGQTNCEGTGTATVDPKCAWSGVVARTGRTGLRIGQGYENTSVMIAQNGTAGYASGIVVQSFEMDPTLDSKQLKIHQEFGANTKVLREHAGKIAQLKFDAKNRKEVLAVIKQAIESSQ